MKFSVVVVLATLMSVSALTPASAASSPREATLTVSGHASVSRAPDRATIPLAIVTNDDRAATALSDNNAKYAAIVAALAREHVAASAIETTGFSTAFNARPAKPDPQFAQRFGYIVTRSLSIAVDDLASVGRIVDALTAAAAPDIGSISYGLRDSASVQRTAQAAAIKDALAQAQVQATAAGVHIVRVLAIGSQPATVFAPRVMSMNLALAKSAPDVPTDLPASDVRVDATITVTYAIAQGAAH